MDLSNNANDEKVAETGAVSEPVAAKPELQCNYCGAKPSLFLHRDEQARDVPLRSVCVDCFVSVFDKVLSKPAKNDCECGDNCGCKNGACQC